MTILDHQLKDIAESIKQLDEKKGTVIPDTPLTNKMWILPDGTVQPLNQWHWQWVKSNPEVAERFGVAKAIAKIPASDENKGKPILLRAGFIRVNYESNGNLTIEGCAKFWNNKIKGAVFMLVCDNSKKIYGITVNLFDETSKRLVKTASVQLFKYSDKEKLDHIPFVSESAHGKALRFIRLMEGSLPS